MCVLVALIVVASIDFWPARERDFHVPYDKTSHSIYDEMGKEPTYYRVIITLEGDPIFSYSPAFHGREIFDGYYIEGTPLREVLYSLRWMTVHAERGELLTPYFELFSIRRFITSPQDVNLPFYLTTFPAEDFTFHTGEDYAYLELNNHIPFARTCSSTLYIGNPDDIMSTFESLLFTRAPIVLIRGHGPYVDDYTLEELSQYDSLLLYRWTFRDQSYAENLLRKYVEQGGTVFVSPFYEGGLMGRLFYTVESTGNCSQGYFVETNSSYTDTIFCGVNVTDFAPAIYAGGPWRYVAVNGSSNVLMWVDGNPVLAIDPMGKGKVVWVGFNLLMHIWFYLNPQEALLIRNIVEYTLAVYPEGWMSNFKMEKRPYGYIDMSFNTVDTRDFWLLISETYFPGWRAYVNGVVTPLQGVEPGLITLKLGGDSSYRVSMEYGYTNVHYAGWTITILTLIVIGGVLFVPRLRRKLVKRPHNHLVTHEVRARS